MRGAACVATSLLVLGTNNRDCEEPYQAMQQCRSCKSSKPAQTRQPPLVASISFRESTYIHDEVRERSIDFWFRMESG